MADDPKKTSVGNPRKGIPAAPLPSPEKWSVRDLRGTIAEVVQQLQDFKPLTEEGVKAGQKPHENIRGVIPPEDMEWLIRKIKNKSAAGWRGVVVDVHDHYPDGKDDVGSWHISKLY